jgi:flagellar basal body-associated protein FliL
MHFQKKGLEPCSFFYMFDENYPVKVQELLAEYLYQHKTLKLPSIGLFELDPAVNVYESKDEPWPENAIRFTRDTSTAMDEHLLSFLVERSGKMKPLAQSDLESFLMNGLQLLNIGKPFQLKGIGLLSKIGSNELTFQQGLPNVDRTEQPSQSYVLKDRTRKDEEVRELDFSHSEKKSSKKLLILLGSILAVGLISWAVYLALPSKEKETVQEPVLQEAADTTTTPAPVVDTSVTIQQPDSTTITTQVTDTSNGFSLIIQTFKFSKSANDKLEILKARGHNVTLEQKDSSLFYLVLKVNKPLSDTTVVKDSLQRWYLWKARLYKTTAP